MITFQEQIRSNSLALISLAVAFIALGYNTWRNETTESHRNVREASFRVLESLGELQEVADHRYYYLPFENTEGREGELRLRGFGRVAMVRDLMNLMPGPSPAKGFGVTQWCSSAARGFRPMSIQECGAKNGR